MPEKLKGMVLCALAMATVGSTVVASKVIAGGLPPFTATALRFALALPVFLLLMRALRAPWPRPDRHDALLLLCQAGLGSVGYTVLLILGLRLASAADAGVVAGTLPAVAVAALVAVPPLALSTLMTGLGLALSVPGALVEQAWERPLPAAALAGVAYYALVPTVGGFLLWFAGARRLHGAQAALFTALLPVSALALAALVLGEAVGGLQLAGAACVLGAVGLTSLDGWRRPEPPEKTPEPGGI